MIPLKLEIEGFGLYKEKQVIDFTQFENDGVIGIIGENLDSSGGYTSNGAGKSWIMNAISWVLFDRIAIQADTTIGKEDVINHFSKKAIVRFSLMTDDGKNSITVENSRSKSSKELKLWINDRQYDANTDTQVRNKLFSILGLKSSKKDYFSDFLNSFYFSGETSSKFASKATSGKERLQTITRFKKLEVYDALIKKASVKNSQLDNSVKSLQRDQVRVQSQLDPNYNEDLYNKKITSASQKITQIESELELQRTYLEKNKETQELKNQLQKNHTTLKTELAKVTNQIDNFVINVKSQLNVYLEFKKNLLVEEENLKAITAKLAKLPQTDVSGQLSSEVTELTVKYNQFISDIGQLKKEIKFLDGLDILKCPECGKEVLMEDGKLIKFTKKAAIEKKLELENQILQIEKKKLELNEQINLKKKEIDFVKTQLKEVSDVKLAKARLETTIETINKGIISSFNNVKEYMVNESRPELGLDSNISLYTSYDEYTEIVQKLAKLEEEINGLEFYEIDMDHISSLNSELTDLKLQIQEMRSQIKIQSGLLTELATIQKDLSENLESLKIYSFWIEKYRFLKNEELLEIKPQLNLYTNKIFEDLGTNIRVDFDINFDSNELDLELTEDSGEVIPAELFSCGQSQRIGIATGLALRRISAESEFNLGITLWDEVFDGLDDAGKEMFFGILQQTSGFKLLISHDDSLKSYLNDTIQVTRKNHSSSIKIISKQ